MADPLYPDVPDTPGVPPVLRDDSADRSGVERQTTDNSSLGASAPFVWGIFDTGGARIIEPTSIIAFEYSNENRLVDYPLEAGGFETYNKVNSPFEIRVAMTKDGTLTDRQAFLKDVETLLKALTLVNVVTPEKTYLNVNLYRVNVPRSATSGAGMLNVEIGLREIRETANVTFTQTEAQPGIAANPETAPETPNPAMTPSTVRSPSAARPRSNGSVQPRDPLNPLNVSAAERNRLETQRLRSLGLTVREE